MSKIKNIISIIIVIITLIPIISAFSVSTLNWDTNPAIAAPGETIEIRLYLQNMIGGNNLTVKAELESDIAEITDANSTYSLPFGTKDLPVNIRIKIPSNASNNTDYKISVLFTPNIDYGETGGLVQFDTKTSGDIYVKVIKPSSQKETKSENHDIIITSLSALFLIIIAYLFMRNPKKTETPKPIQNAQEITNNPGETQTIQQTAPIVNDDIKTENKESNKKIKKNNKNKKAKK